MGLYRGHMEKKMEIIIMGLYRVLEGLYRDNGKENGTYYMIIGYIYWGLGF